MASHSPHRVAVGLGAALSATLALALCFAPASAEEQAKPATEASTTPKTADPTVGEVLEQPLPGREALQGLKRTLSVPSAESRWRGLPVFGRDLFREAAERFAPVENVPVGPDYVLGPGDHLIVYVSSFSDTSFALTLDREGKAFLPRVGTVFLWGLSFADAEALVKSRLATVLRNARVQVSMGRVRAIDVFVLGAAVRPGKYTLTGLATAFHALAAAGGPAPLGSMRSVRVLRADREVAKLDLYRFLLAGDGTNDARLQNGDVVFVDLARAYVGIQGAVTRPGVYETEGPVTMSTLLELAGGASPFADLSRIRIERVDANGGFRLQDLPLNHGRGVHPDSLALSSFDLVTIQPLNERVRNAVTLDGFVRHQGEYELTPGLRLSQLVTQERLLPEASLDQAELRRVDSTTFAVDVRSVSIRKAWSGEDDPELHALDAVTVFSSARFPRTVTLEGEVVRPGTYTVAPGERLSEVLRRAGGPTANGYLPAAVFVRRSTAAQERAFTHEFVQRQRLDLAQQRSRLAQSGDSTGAQAVQQAELELLGLLEHQSDPGRVVLDLDPAGRWKGSARDPALEDGDKLYVPLRPATVAVLGSVMSPGAVMARKGATLNDYLRMAGGPSRQADLGKSYVLRMNGAAVPRGAAGRVEAGDAIVVPPRSSEGSGFGRNLASSSRFLIELVGAAALIMAARR